MKLSKHTGYSRIILVTFMGFIPLLCTAQESPNLILNDQGYFMKRGLNVLVFSNMYNENFSDSKISGIEIIHHGIRTATNGDVRLEPTPGQWDEIPSLVERRVRQEENSVEADLEYRKHGFAYRIQATATSEGIELSLYLEHPLPESLEGRAGFNLEFLPPAYFEKTWVTDEGSGLFPLYPGGPMKKTVRSPVEPLPLAGGKILVLAPGDPKRRVRIESKQGELLLFDGRNKAQNGWFVVREEIPGGKTGKVLEWKMQINTLDNWVRPPVIAHSQLGYHPSQRKTAILELDPMDKQQKICRLINISADGVETEVLSGIPETWGRYLRYDYCLFDFSDARTPGIYRLEYGEVRTKPFRIAGDVYDNAWQPTLDVYFPVQMDHMLVNEAYRVWHGAAHLDDALQAPVNHVHFDLYAQGPSTDTPYKPGEHIPGLNVGGWFDAGDYDIRTQTHYHVVSTLVHAWEEFRPERDETLIDRQARYVDIHHPDGKPDLLQQIEHGTLALLAQHRAVGHAIAGIIVPDLSQYTHLGDALTMTDNLVYDPLLAEDESNAFRSGRFDDRWAFTSYSTPLNYGSIAALAAASRALRGYNDSLAEQCLATAIRVWKEEHSREPLIFSHGNTTGGRLEREELSACVELLICTGDPGYRDRILEMKTYLERSFNFNAELMLRAMPYMGEDFASGVKKLVWNYSRELERIEQENPFGVPISRGGWAGNGWVLRFTQLNYLLHRAFPEIIEKDYVYRGLNYLYGCHPGSDISFVSGIGTHSKKVAYGMNRADYSFIAGGIVPGVLIIRPDFPENKEDWPFLWGQNEYVIGAGASYIYAVNAVIDILERGH